VIRGSSTQNPSLRTWIQKLRFAFHTVSCRAEAHTKERIWFFFHLLQLYYFQVFKNVNNKTISLSRDVLKVPLYDVLGASRCTPRHQFMSSAGCILLIHDITCLLNVLLSIG